MSNGEKIESGPFCVFRIIDAPKGANPDELAESLIEMKNVVEIFLEEISNGFSVRAKFARGKKPVDVIKYMASHLDRKFGIVASPA